MYRKHRFLYAFFDKKCNVVHIRYELKGLIIYFIRIFLIAALSLKLSFGWQVVVDGKRFYLISIDAKAKSKDQNGY